MLAISSARQQLAADYFAVLIHEVRRRRGIDAAGRSDIYAKARQAAARHWDQMSRFNAAKERIAFKEAIDRIEETFALGDPAQISIERSAPKDNFNWRTVAIGAGLLGAGALYLLTQIAQ